jgi:restriction endonuclease S subunit
MSKAVWKRVKLSEVLHRVKHPVAIVPDHDYRLVTIRMHHKGVVQREVKKGAEIGSAMYQVQAGQFILSGIDARNGAFGIIPHALDGAVVTNDFWYFDIDNTVISTTYFLHLTATSMFDEICRKASDGTTNRVRLQADKFFGYEIILPPLEEQERIAAHIERITACSQALRHELATQKILLAKLREAILREAVQGKLTHQNPADEDASHLLARIKAEKAAKGIKEKPLPPIKPEEIPYELPQGWMWCRLGEIAYSISTGPFGTMLHKSDYVENGIPLVNPMNIVDEKIVPSNKMMVSEVTKQKLKSYILKTGDIVIGRRGEMGRCAIVTDKESGWLCGTGSFFLELSTEIYKPFFIKVLRSDFSKVLLLGASVGSTMNNLNHKILSNLLFPLPPLAEQERVVVAVERLLEHVSALEKEVLQEQETLGRLMQSALREVFGGGAEEEQPSTESEKFF